MSKDPKQETTKRTVRKSTHAPVHKKEYSFLPRDEVYTPPPPAKNKSRVRSR